MTSTEQTKREFLLTQIRQSVQFTLFVGVVNALFIATLTYFKGEVDWTLTAQAFGSGCLIAGSVAALMFGISFRDYKAHERRVRDLTEPNESKHD
jgi:hypothetical protein